MTPPRAARLSIKLLALWAAVSAPASAALASDARCPGQRFAIDSVAGGSAPYIRLTVGSHSGPFLLDYGTTGSTLSADLVNGRAGGTVAVDNFTLPTFANARFGLAHYRIPRPPAGGQVGVVGTDALSLLTADFAFTPRGADVVLSVASCDAASLRRRGLVPIGQAGFFSSSPASLPSTRSNVPVLYLRLGDVTTWAQIDTGYDDLQAPLSIDINDALFRRLRAAGVPLTPAPPLTIATCAGVETREVYVLEDAAVMSETGAPIHRLGRVNLVRKVASNCGGIAGLDEPAAQAAASVLVRLGAVVFDPRAEQVWVAAQR